MTISDMHFPVWYATTRRGIYDSQGQLLGFASQLANVSYGKCFVYIPGGHFAGEIRSGFWQRVKVTLTFWQNKQALHLISTRAQNMLDYWSEVQATAAKWAANERCALVFIHGYNVSFEEAALKAAQLGHNLHMRGPISFFSWPSQSTILGYPAVEAALEVSEAAIATYLLDFAQYCGTERVHIIAYSMENCGMLRALQRITATTAMDAPRLFEHVILTIPDVDKALLLSRRWSNLR